MASVFFFIFESAIPIFAAPITMGPIANIHSENAGILSCWVWRQVQFLAHTKAYNSSVNEDTVVQLLRLA